MTPYEIAAFFTLAVLFGIGLLLLNSRNERRWREFLSAQKEDQSISVIGQWLQEMRGSLDRHTDSLNQQMQMSNQAIGERLDNAARVIGIISKELGQVQEIAHQMRDFQDFLRSPKMRGNIGEVILRELLVQVLPQNSFDLQHRFLDGQVVDVAIKTDKGLIPIDSKFPLENFKRAFQSDKEIERKKFVRQFQRDIQNHIDSISTKYIQPQEGTVDFAVMYIPSEAIFYEIVTKNERLVHFAQQKSILLVSPNSFFYFLRVILTGLEGKRIEEASRRILSALNAMSKDSEKVAEQLRIVSTHVTNAKSAVDRLNNDFLRLSNRLEDTKYLKSNAESENVVKTDDKN